MEIFSWNPQTSLTIICCKHGHCLKLQQSNPVTQGFSFLLNPIKNAQCSSRTLLLKNYKYCLKRSFCFRALPSCSVYTVMLFFGHRSTLVLYFMLFACHTNPPWFLGKHGLVSAYAHVFLLKSRLMPSFYALCRPLTRYSVLFENHWLVSA